MFVAEHQNLGDEGRDVLLASTTLVPAARRAGELHVDGTFKVVPSMFMQLFTVHFVSFNHVCNNNSVQICVVGVHNKRISPIFEI